MPETTDPDDKPEAPKPVNWYSGWRLLVTATLTVVLAKMVGVVGALVALPLFFWLQPKRGSWLALAVAVVAGVLTAVLYSAFVLPSTNTAADSKHPSFQFDPSTAKLSN